MVARRGDSITICQKVVSYHIESKKLSYTRSRKTTRRCRGAHTFTQPIAPRLLIFGIYTPAYLYHKAPLSGKAVIRHGHSAILESFQERLGRRSRKASTANTG